MFIDVVPNGRSAPAVLLRESRREGKRVHKRTLANLSQLPPELVDGLRALLAGAAVVGGPADAFEIQRSLPHGHAAAVIGMMRKQEIPPGSKLSPYGRWPRRRRVPAWAASQQTRIERHLAKHQL